MTSCRDVLEKHALDSHTTHARIYMSRTVQLLLAKAAIRYTSTSCGSHTHTAQSQKCGNYTTGGGAVAATTRTCVPDERLKPDGWKFNFIWNCHKLLANPWLCSGSISCHIHIHHPSIYPIRPACFCKFRRKQQQKNTMRQISLS